MNQSRKITATFSLLALGSAGAASAEMLDERLAQVVPSMIEVRHHIHRNPELSNREFETGKYLAQQLRDIGLVAAEGVAHTGVVALLEGDRRGPVVAIRADIDALPVTEATGFPFASSVRTTYQGKEVGVAHACGHDIHMAVVLGVAALLYDMRAELPGAVKFIFQPAEEGVPPGENGGAAMMLEEGVFEDPEPSAIFGLHAWPALAVGQLGYVSGPTMASSDRFGITITGRQVHGAWPHLGTDPVLAAAQTVVALQSIVSRSLDPLQPAVVTVGTIHGGERYNIIPGQVSLEGTVRTFDTDVQDTIERRMGEIVAGVGRASGATAELVYLRTTPVLSNDPALSAWSRGVLEDQFGADSVIEQQPVMGGEDFAFFSRAKPGFYLRLGVVKPGTESGALHTPDMRADDSAIAVGIKAMAALVLGYLQANPLQAEVASPPDEGITP